MNKLECLEKLIGKKIDILDRNFKVSMNSKELSNNYLFFAINKGNEYIDEAEKNGAFVIYDDDTKKVKNGFLVKNTIKFMQEFANFYRNENNFTVVGITGSNGKTTVKDILYSVLFQKGFKVYKTQGNYNNHIGLPFTILSASDEDKYLLLEMGMSDLGEIELLAQISNPDYSIITNIGQSHLEYLKTMENVFKAKTELIPYTRKKVVVNGEDKYLSTLKNVVLVKKEYNKTNLMGEHNQMNISLVKALLNEMGIKDVSFENITLTSGRFQLVEGKYRYINDAYNASPISMKASMETFNTLFNEDCKVMVLGDMLELGEKEIEYHVGLINYIYNTKFDYLFLYGPRMKHLYNKIKATQLIELANSKEPEFVVNWYEDKEEIKKDINKIETNKKITVLLKGSRSMKMEQVMEGTN